MECPHIEDYFGVCTQCGADLSSIDRKTATVYDETTNAAKGLQVTQAGLERDLEASGKLLLILDIDHTILHATHDPR